MTEYKVRSTDNELVYILSADDNDIETITLPNQCIFLSDLQRDTIITAAVTDRFKLGANHGNRK